MCSSAKNRRPLRTHYEPVVPTSRSYEDDLHELWAAGQWQGEYDPQGFKAAFEHTGRRIVLASLTDEELAALGLRIMVSTDTEPPERTP